MDVQIIQTILQKQKIGEDIPGEYLMSTIWGFDHIENKHALYRGKDCMKKFFISVREQAKKNSWFWKEKNLTVTKRRIKITSRCKCILYLWKKNLKKAF